jgi:hypothetical protein
VCVGSWILFPFLLDWMMTGMSFVGWMTDGYTKETLLMIMYMRSLLESDGGKDRKIGQLSGWDGMAKRGRQRRGVCSVYLHFYCLYLDVNYFLLPHLHPLRCSGVLLGVMGGLRLGRAKWRAVLG